MTLDDLRRFAVTRTLFPPATLEGALDRLGFVQADPIRSPARAQDLILRHRVAGYRAGDLERRYPVLDVEEDVFINYGFVTRRVQALMHPRAVVSSWPASRRRRAGELLVFVRSHGEVHPRAVDAHFAHGSVTNYWGGSSSATTHLLDAMHYAGLVRVSRRDGGIRLYTARDPYPRRTGAEARRSLDALVDLVVDVYGPVPSRSLGMLVARLRYAAPQWHGQIKGALRRAKDRLSHAHVEGHEWYWPASEVACDAPPGGEVRLLAPFDPVVWDRRRFEHLWGWEYRFEAYTPIAKRQFGYYALPLLWRDRVIGWANVSVRDGELGVETGYVSGSRPRDRAFVPALSAEIDRMRAFLDVPGPGASRARGSRAV